MLKIRKSADRGKTKTQWLESWHSFSFGEYYDPNNQGFETLRVINDDIVQPSQGFGKHPHHDMEIITYVLTGALEHKDSMGNGSVIKHGDVQYMCAGKGVEHSEFNPLDKESVHLLQIWILPNAQGLPQHYEQKSFSRDKKLNKLCLVVSNNGRDNSIKINQNVDMYVVEFGQKPTTIKHQLKPKHKAWIQVARGEVMVNGEKLSQGDGASTDAAEKLEISSEGDAEVILFDITVKNP